MCEVLTETGIDWRPLAAGAGIDQATVDDPQGLVSGMSELRFQQAFAIATSHVPGLWFRTGLRYRALTFGPLGLMALASARLDTALPRFFGSLQDLTYSFAPYEIQNEDGELRCIFGNGEGLASGFREFTLERDLAGGTMLLYDLMQGPFPLDRIETSLARPPNWREWEDALGTSLVFGAAGNRWVFLPGSGAWRLPLASQLLESTYTQVCVEVINRAYSADDFVEKVSAVVLGPSGAKRAGDVAQLLGLSERTFHRRLSERQLTYGDLVRQVRERVARELLETSTLTIDQISEFLGYAEQASFSHAFKRWTGVSPLQYRRLDPATPAPPPRSGG